VPALEPGDGRRFMLLRCERCGSETTAGDPPGPELYEGGLYTTARPQAEPLVRAWRRLTVGQPARMLSRAGLGAGARVLDAGAGRGRHLAALRAAGFDARGIDPSGRAPAGAVVAHERIDEHEDRDLDAVLLWHVLEHLEQPAGELERVRGWLRPGGLLLVGVPNVRSLQAQIAGERWVHFDVPRHRTHFSPAGLAALLRRTGFEPERAHHVVWEHNPASMWMSLLSRGGLPPGAPLLWLKRELPLGAREAALAAVAAPVALPLELLAGAARRGGTIAVVARCS
jgi:SAM-dependent methyltransferase